MINKSEVTKVCIDDFALKKREKYGTVMVDIDTHKILDMIESRELETVKKWLEGYKNLAVVSRDGSITYKNAITQSHPNAIQVSDRFHILKNLTNYCKDFLKKHLNNRVIVDELKKDNNNKKTANKNYSLKEKYELVKTEISTGIKISNACKKYHLDIRCYKKIAGFTDDERLAYFTTKRETKENESIANKMKLVSEVREAYKNIASIRKVAEICHLSRKTVRKYLDDSFSPVHASKGIKRKSILDPYKSIIDDSIRAKAKSKAIEEAIRIQGYMGSSSTIRRYISDRKKEIYSPSVKSNTTEYAYVERKKLMKLLYHDIDKVKGLTKEIVEKVYQRDLIFQSIIKLVENFRNLMKTKEVNKLETWIKEAESMEIKELNSFINGINRDIEAVRNAIVYDYNNGLAEGKVNKIKVTKRIMYGRCGFKLLKQKSLLLESQVGFN